ncbi:LuxR C-terminal-related transcriptional regulator [Glutamicibacter sp. MNS18]|uniref:helix-turn-helix transcriptional regulator n=1 Tax=Glutamicibacter sp. MNS18 TaxID=2989817 RepID=UPI002236406B|nr:LuxR family transcriptional regulator [Glutamicibacter sp. MNS18]MCW4466143.1 LuxR C-terminal-related transcriptional regulator [Glutamicibacter sp. MNS18]
MGVFSASENWLNHWDGHSEDCWRAEHESSLVRKEVQVRLKRLAQQSSSGGYVVRGAFGTGKRELVRAAFQHPEVTLEPTWVSGSYYGSAKPYGAIQFLLTGLEDHRVESPLAVFGFLKQQFSGFDERPLIIVEHVGLIDPLTTAVLCQLVSNNIIKMVVIDDLADALSEDLAALVRSGLMEVFQLNELTLNEARTQISMMLDLNVSYLTAIRLWKYAAGSSEALRAVVLDCREADMFEVKGEAAALRSDPIPVGSHMEQHTAGRLERLSLGKRELLERVAVAGALPEEEPGGARDEDIDFLFARGLLQHSAGHWRIANPAIASSLIAMQGGMNEWQVNGSDNDRSRSSTDAPKTEERPADRQPDSGRPWARIRRDAQALAEGGATNDGIAMIQRFLDRDARIPGAAGSTGDPDEGHARLLQLELCLAASRLAEAEKILSALDPIEPSGCWFQLDLCQQYRALALLAEYQSRTNQFEQAEALLEVLLEPLGQEATEYSISECMGPSLRSMINTSISLGKWEQGRKLIQLVLAGSLPDMQLIAYAETVHAVMLGFAGNYAEAQKIIAPLQLQIHRSGTRIQQIFIDSVDLYVTDRSGQGSINATTNLSSAELEAVPMLGLECLWQSLRLVARHSRDNGHGTAVELEKLARWAELRGEKLTASHLWASVIRHGGFHAAPHLRQLQHEQHHELAVAFRTLSDGAQMRDSHTLASAVGSLASLGFVAYATDDGSEIFQLMNSGQRRQASRKANNFMMSLQPELVHPQVYANLGRLTVLTERERFVASAAASGLSNLEIAEQASVSVRTVEGHLYQVYSKLGISRRGELSALTGASRPVEAAR